MLWMIVPLVLVIAQLQFHYGYTAIRARQPVLLKVQLRDASARSAPAAVDGEARRTRCRLARSTGGIEVETPAVWLPSRQRSGLAVAPQAAGALRSALHGSAMRIKKTLVVPHGGRRSPVRLEAAFLNELLYPSEPPLPGEARSRPSASAVPEGDCRCVRLGAVTG